MTSPPTGTPWTCPFCALLCDGFEPRATAAGYELSGSDCSRARTALARFAPTPSTATPRIDGQPATLDAAVAAAAQVLQDSHQPLFSGLATDIAGARALYRLACASGAITEPANGRAYVSTLRTLQDRGGFSTTFAEVQGRADVIVVLGTSPAVKQPEFYRRCGFGLPAGEHGEILPRHVAFVGGTPEPALAALPGVTVEAIAPGGDLHDTLAMLNALVAGRAPRRVAPALADLAKRLLGATYAVVTYDTASLPEPGALITEGVNGLVGTLNRTTRAGSLGVGGSDGAASTAQTYTWMSGLPLRTRVGPRGLDHEPHAYDGARLLANGGADALLWLAAFGPEPALPAIDLPRIVIGHPDLAVPTGGGTTIHIPVATPGIGASGHVFRADGTVVLPLRPLRDEALPTAADVIGRLHTALIALRPAAATAGATV